MIKRIDNIIRCLMEHNGEEVERDLNKEEVTYFGMHFKPRV